MVKNGEEIWVIGDLEMDGRFECIRVYNVFFRLWRIVFVFGLFNCWGYFCCMFYILKYLIDFMVKDK